MAKLRGWLAEQPGPPARYIGAVAGDRKLSLLSAAWLLVLPSYSENYGIVVAEALASGTPVLTTTEVPWAELEPAGCGWVIPLQVDALAQALQRALHLPPEDHELMRVRARILVNTSHSLQSTVLRMERSYDEVVTGKPGIASGPS